MAEPSGTQYGGFWIRFLALLADSAIVFLVSAFLIAGAAMALGPEELTMVALVVWLLGFLYWPVMHASKRQATFGKRSDTKRAIVTLAAGDRIELFES